MDSWHEREQICPSLLWVHIFRVNVFHFTVKSGFDETLWILFFFFFTLEGFAKWGLCSDTENWFTFVLTWLLSYGKIMVLYR
jgi:hypothetical protein